MRVGRTCHAPIEITFFWRFVMNIPVTRWSSRVQRLSEHGMEGTLRPQAANFHGIIVPAVSFMWRCMSLLVSCVLPSHLHQHFVTCWERPILCRCFCCSASLCDCPGSIIRPMCFVVIVAVCASASRGSTSWSAPSDQELFLFPHADDEWPCHASSIEWQEERRSSCHEE